MSSSVFAPALLSAVQRCSTSSLQVPSLQGLQSTCSTILCGKKNELSGKGSPLEQSHGRPTYSHQSNKMEGKEANSDQRCPMEDGANTSHETRLSLSLPPSGSSVGGSIMEIGRGYCWSDGQTKRVSERWNGIAHQHNILAQEPNVGCGLRREA